MENKNMITAERLKSCRIKADKTLEQIGVLLNVHKTTVMRWEKGETERIGLPTIQTLASYYGVNPAWLMGADVSPTDSFVSPTVTDNIVTLPVIGDIAAGFDKIANEDWSGETIEIPRSYLKGRPASDFTVLTVSGDSMYPLYQEGDKVVILKQPTLNRSGEIGAIVYEGECVSLKKIEYVDGEDWLKMISINPQYMPKKISGADLELCHIIGIPVLLIREIN